MDDSDDAEDDLSSTKLLLPATCNPPSDRNPPKQAVWIVFGATGHMGRSLVRTAVSHGDLVTAVGKSFENTQEQMDNWHEQCHGMLCDVRMRQSVQTVISGAIKRWGRVDIIANCTGYGVIAAAEDQSDFDLSNQFQTNFMGTLHIIQSSLPYFRTNSIPGRYLIFSSTAGALGVPGLAPYCATKYAVEGLIESMLYEVHSFGIKSTLVEPGHARDDDKSTLIPSQQYTAAADAIDYGTESDTRRTGGPEPVKRYGHFSVHVKPSEPYESSTSPAGHAKRMVQWMNRRQPTSAVRSCELVWQLGHCSYPPLRLLLGNFAVESIRDRLRSIIEEIEDWKHLSFPQDEDGLAKAEEFDDGDRDAGDQSDEEAIEDETLVDEGD